MFFLIPVAAVVASTAATTIDVLLGAAAVSAGVAFGAKKIACSVERNNMAALAKARTAADSRINECRNKASKEKAEYKEAKMRDLYNKVENCRMRKADKAKCFSHLSSSVTVTGGK